MRMPERSRAESERAIFLQKEQTKNSVEERKKECRQKKLKCNIFKKAAKGIIIRDKGYLPHPCLGKTPPIKILTANR